VLSGCPQQLPVLRTDEMRLCGALTVHPTLVGPFQKAYDLWRAEVAAGKKSAWDDLVGFLPRNAQPQEVRQLYDDLIQQKDRMRANILSTLMLNTYNVEHFSVLDDTPYLAWGTYTATVQEQDLKLWSGPGAGTHVPVGNLGLVAKKQLPAYTVLGVLGGYYLPEVEFVTKLQKEGHAHCSCWNAAAAGADSKKLWTVALHSYSQSNVTLMGKQRLSVSGLGYGNEGQLLNDPLGDPLTWAREYSDFATDPENWPLPDDQDLRQQGGANCTVFVFEIQGIPIPFIITTTKVDKGCRLLRDYGLLWWDKYVKKLDGH